MNKVYLDNASTTPIREEVLQKIYESLTYFGNPSSTHSFGRTTKSFIEKARKNIAKEFAVSPSEIIFTSSGTEAINMIIRGAVRDLNITQIITSPIEHHAVLHTISAMENEYGTRITFVKLTKEGSVDLQDLEKSLSEIPNDERILVSLMHVNNEIGNILPLQETAEICKKYNAYFHSDMVQSVGHFSVDFSQIPIDFISASAHKFYGPKGIGFAFIRKNIPLHSFIFGGEQERGKRAGTEAVHNVVGMEEAFLLAYQNLDTEKNQISKIKQYFIEELTKNIPNIRFNGASADLRRSAYTILNIGLPTDAKKTEIVMLYLDMKGIACSKGSACQSGSVQVSHVLKNILPEKELKLPNLRFSFSIFTTLEEIDFVVKTLKEFITE
ncbi:MAG: cysteine desulfurase family protein [Capnocytophaga sp.]|nr:cysteine desulfurase family protein [Capnocytophaga sp.]